MNKKSEYEQEKDKFFSLVNLISDNEKVDNQLQSDFKHWVRYRKLHSDFLVNGSNSQFYKECKTRSDDINVVEKNIFLLFHYGPYFSFPLHFIKKYGYSGAAFILSAESIDFKLVDKCAESFGIELEAIVIDEAGFFVKKVLKAKKAGKCIFILVDLPFGSDDKNYKMFDVGIGKIRHRLGYMRIASMIKQIPSLILPEISDDYASMYIRHIEVENHEDVVREFMGLLKKDYKNFERFNELERLFDFY